MPRGRKGPPQDSIDSILLALSRRTDIDNETLSHYFDRLDEEWADGARDKVLHLLHTNDAAAHSAAVLILSELATNFDLEELEDLVADPTVGDLAKLTLAPVLKELGSEMADDGIIEYLNDPEAAMQQTLLQPQPLYEARVSFVDGSGAQMIMLSWKRSDGLLKGVNVLCQDNWGIKDCYGTDEMEVERWSELVESMEEQGFGSFKVSLDYCRALIADARASNKRTRHKLPVAYPVWRSFIESNDPSAKETPPVRLEPLPFSPALAQLAQRGDELLQLPEFESWTFEPFASIQPYVQSYIGAFSPADSSHGRRRKGGQRMAVQKTNQETIVSEVLDQVVDDKWRLTYEAHLRRQGALYKFLGRTDDASLVRPVAAPLHPDSRLAVRQQPFMRALMHRSLRNGFLRMMAEAPARGPLGSLPPHLFSAHA